MNFNPRQTPDPSDLEVTMCGRLENGAANEFLSWGAYHGMLAGATAAQATEPIYNVAPTVTIMVIVPESAGLTMESAMLGYLPAWQVSKGIMRRHVNARSETAFEKPTFRGPLRTSRAVILANGFYEWRRDAKDRPLQAYHICHPDKQPLRIAAQREYFFGKSGLSNR